MGYFNNTILDAQDSQLISVWKFEGNLIDDKGSQDLTEYGTAGSYVAGKRGQGYDFVLGDNYNFVDTVGTVPQNEFLISFWVKIDGGKGGTFILPSTLPGISAGLTADSFLFVSLMDDRNELHIATVDMTSFSGAFVHVAMAALDDEFYVFVNGVQALREEFSGRVRQYSSKMLKIGQHSTQVVDEVYIWTEPTLASYAALVEFIEALTSYFASYLPVEIDESLELYDNHGDDNYLYETLADGFAIVDLTEAAITFVGAISESLVITDSSYYGWVEELAESLGLADSHVAQYILGQCNLEESILLLDIYGWAWLKELDESLVMTDSSSTMLSIILREVLLLSENNPVNWSGSESVNELLGLSDGNILVKIFNDTLAESISFVDAVDKVISILVQEYMTLHDVTNSTWNGSEVIAESLYVADDERGARIFVDLISDGFSISDALSSTLSLLIQESLGFAVSTLSSANFANTNTETLGFADSNLAAYLMELQESIGLSDTVGYSFLLLCLLSESIGLVDTDTPTRTTSPIISEELEFTTDALTRAILSSLIDESLGLNLGLEFDGDAWQCWVMNTSDFHISVYSDFNFNSFCVYNGEAFGAKADGIYKLTGDSDNDEPIVAGVSLPETRFGSAYNKRFRRAHFGMSGGSPAIRIETDNGTQIFNITGVKCNVGRALKGKTWQLQLQDFESLDFIELIPIILAR